LCDGRKYISLLQSSGKTEVERKKKERDRERVRERGRGKECRKCELKKDKPEYTYIVPSRKGENLKEN